MEWISYVLFDLGGRIKRSTWLVCFAALALTEFLAGTLFRQIFDMGSPAPAEFSAEAYFDDRAALLSGLIFLWPSVAVDVKRWHDMGKSGWLTLIAYAPVFAIYLLEELKSAGAIALTRPLPEALFSVIGLVFLVYLILLGAGKSSLAANRFGA